MNRAIVAVAMLFACAVLLMSCGSTDVISRRSEIAESSADEHFTIMTKDSVVYELEQVTLKDSSISGEGEQRIGNVPAPFAGTIPLANIQYILKHYENGFKLALIAGGIGLVGVEAYLALNNHEPLTAREASYVPTGSSCPYLYSWDGSRYVLEGEAFGIAWGKRLEMQTVTVLPSLAADHGEVHVRMANERPETHFVNSARLVAVETDPGVQVVADLSDVFWPVHGLLAPMRAVDGSGRDALAELAQSDGHYWESDLRETEPGSSFRDALDIELPCPAQATDGTLVIRGVNTSLFTGVLQTLCTMMGDDYLYLVRALDTDPEMSDIVRNAFRESSLLVEMWNGKEWMTQGALIPEASVAPIRRAVRLHAGESTSDRIRIRLSCATGSWDIDEVGIDWTQVLPLDSSPVPLLSAVGPQGRDVRRTLEESDGNYVSVLPSECIDLRYRAVTPSPGKCVTYAAAIRGYMHEWPVGKPAIRAAALTSPMGGDMKIAYLKMLAGAKSIFLPPIYAELKRQKQM